MAHGVEMKRLYITDSGKEEVKYLFGTNKCLLEALVNTPHNVLGLIQCVRQERIEYKYVRIEVFSSAIASIIKLKYVEYR